jgi:hypothetical protein
VSSDTTSTAFEYSVEAFNTATESTNRMHDDEVAKTFGFHGGLVPGVDVWAYMTRPCVDRWGSEFLTRGTMSARFTSPVYDGEAVDVLLDPYGTLTLSGPDGGVRASGSASLADLPDVLTIEATPETPPPANTSPATRHNLETGTVLKTLRFTYRRTPAAQYLRDIHETSALYEEGGVCHPGFLARQANYVLSRTVQLGPWIHVSTTAHHRALVHDGDEVEVRGIVTNEFERKGHRFVDLNVEVSANGVPAWSASHTAIWKPR